MELNYSELNHSDMAKPKPSDPRSLALIWDPLWSRRQTLDQRPLFLGRPPAYSSGPFFSFFSLPGLELQNTSVGGLGILQTHKCLTGGWRSSGAVQPVSVLPTVLVCLSLGPEHGDPALLPGQGGERK